MSWLSDLLRRLGGLRVSIGGDDDDDVVIGDGDKDHDGIPDRFDDREDRADGDAAKDDSDDSGDSGDGGDDGGSDD